MAYRAYGVLFIDAPFEGKVTAALLQLLQTPPALHFG